MVKLVVLVTAVALSICFFLQTSEAKRPAGQGFCFQRYNQKTGECKKRMKVFRQLKGDCCSNGGGGWSSKKKGRTRCEPCKTSNKVTSYWGPWNAWSKCNATCGPSFEVRNRTCISKGKPNCKGSGEEWKRCKTPPCPIDGGWSDWGNWTRCSVTCRNGTQIRTRTCTNPPPQFNGKECQGKLEDGRSCMEQEKCPIDGGWGDWSAWSGCSLTCGIGTRQRERKCDSPKPQYGGQMCKESERLDIKHCREQKCREEFSGSGSGDGWESGDGSGSGSAGSGSGSGADDGWGVGGRRRKRAWSDDEDLR